MEIGIYQIVFAVVLISLLLLTFKNSTYKSGFFNGWVGRYTKNSYRATYWSFNGFVSIPIKIDQPQEKTFTYHLNAEKESLKLILIHPDHSEHEIDSCHEDSVDASREVTFPTPGKYRFRIVGRKTKGSFDVAWE